MSLTDLDVLATNPAGSKYFLVGDVGGTNTRMMLKTVTGEIIKRIDTKTSEFSNFAGLLTYFLEDVPQKPSKIYAAVCFASKIRHNKTVTNANYTWPLTDGDKIKEQFGFKEMVLLNDFEGCGYSVPILDQGLIIPLTSTELPTLIGNFKVMLVGPGTGLGVCLLSQK
jgi:glucokinase